MADRKPKYKCGDLLRDTVTGFEGVALAVTIWMNGCIRYEVQPQALHEGVPVKALWFDEEQLVVVKPTKSVKARPSGGPQDDPSRREGPSH